MEEKFKEKKLNSNDPGVMAAMMWAYENDKFDKESVNVFLAGYNCNRFKNLSEMLNAALMIIDRCEKSINDMRIKPNSIGVDFEALAMTSERIADLKNHINQSVSLASGLNI